MLFFNYSLVLSWLRFFVKLQTWSLICGMEVWLIPTFPTFRETKINKSKCFHSHGYFMGQYEGITLIRAKTGQQNQKSEYEQQDTRYVSIDTREAPQNIWRCTRR